MSEDVATGLESDRTYQIGTDDEASAREYERLRALARWRDPFTIEALAATGIGAGWRCLEVGAGAGSISAWMANEAGAEGSVLSTDVDLRFHGQPSPNTEVRRHDITVDPLPDDEFDLVHVRAVLQHISEREAVLDRLIATLKPGGWLVAEDGDFRAFEGQPLPEPLGALHRLVCFGSSQQGYRDPNFGSRLLHLLQDRGLRDLSAVGRADTMHAGEDSAEWWFLAIEHVRDRLVGAGAFDGADFDAALEQARTPGFVMLGPLSIQVRGRKP